MKTVKEVSILTGVSVRTLHHYDAIGLLKPARITEAGYRLYDDPDLQRLQTILLLRQLEFPLKEIKDILDAPGFDPVAALEQQIKLLELRREQLDKLIAHARQLQKNGGNLMKFDAFDNSKIDAYAAEAKAKWGKTDAYKEFEQKTKGQSKEQQRADGDGSVCRGLCASAGAGAACPCANRSRRGCGCPASGRSGPPCAAHDGFPPGGAWHARV